MAKMVATESFVAEIEGRQFNVSANVTRVDERDELYRAYPHKWARVNDDAPEVEAATAAPGEKRTAKRTS